MSNRKKYIKKGRQAEEEFRKTLNSGAFWHSKGDLVSDEHRVEVKNTSKKGFRITTDLLQKIWNEALDSNKLPMFGIILEGEQYKWILKIDMIKRRKK